MLTTDMPMTDLAAEADTLFRPLLDRRGIVLAVSGGPDSTALMILAAQWLKGEGRDVSLCVSTVDHGLRSEAAEEAALVCANAAKLGLDSVILKARLRSAPSDEGHAGNIQARAREARYRCLLEAARAKGFDTIATAHHREDQAETFLIRLARGSGVYGLGGMASESGLDGLTLARPLLGVDRAFLRAVVADSGLECVADPSNEDLAYARIRWRTMLPDLAANGLSVERIADTAQRMRRAAKALDHYAGDLLQRNIAVSPLGGAEGDAGFLLRAPDETALRALARLLQAVGGSEYTPRLDRVEQLLAAICEKTGQKDGFRRTLNDCLVSLKTGRLSVSREWGREGPPRCRAASGGLLIWDGRFEIELPPELADGIEIAALGQIEDIAAEDGDPVELRTIPALFKGEGLCAVPDIAPRTADRCGLPTFSCRSIVADRLFNPGSNRVVP